MANIAIVNEHDEIIGAGSKQDVRKAGQRHRIVRVLLVDKSGAVLLQKRHPHAHDSPNRWDFSAAGHVDEGEDYLTAAKREMQEEINVTDITLTPALTFYTERTDKGNILRRFNTVFVGKVDREQVRPDPIELGGVAWFSQDEIAKMIQKNASDFTRGLADEYTKIVPHLAKLT